MSSNVIYSGPQFAQIQRLKRFTLGTFMLTFGSIPLFSSLSAQTPSAAALSVLGVSLLATSLSTSLVQYCCTPYVGRIRVLCNSESSKSVAHDKLAPEALNQAAKQMLQPPKKLSLETTTLLGNIRTSIVDAESIQPVTNRKFANWRGLDETTGRARMFFVHADTEEPHPAFSELVMKIGGPAAETALSAIASKQKIEDQEKTRNLDDVVRGLQK